MQAASSLLQVLLAVTVHILEHVRMHLRRRRSVVRGRPLRLLLLCLCENLPGIYIRMYVTDMFDLIVSALIGCENFVSRHSVIYFRTNSKH